MFEAEYARRRTTAEAEAGRICSGDTVYLAGGPLLPVDFAAALHRRAAELHGVRVAGVRLPGTHGLPYGQAWLLFPGGLGLH